MTVRGQPARPHHPAAPRRTARRPQALPRRVDHQRPPRPRRDQDDAADRRRVRGLVLDVLQRASRRATGGAGRSLKSVVLRAELTGTGRVDVYRSKATGARIFVEGRPFQHGESPAPVEFEVEPRAVRGRRLDLVRHHHRQRRHPAERRLVRAGARAGHGQHRGRHADVQPARRLRRHAARADVRPVGRRGDRRGDRARPGHQEAARPSRLRRSRRAAGQPALDPRPAQPRRVRRLQPGHVRGAEEHRLSADPVHGRRHPRRARLDPSGAGDEPVRQDSDARRRPDAQPAGSRAPARDGRGRRPRTTSCGPTRRTPSTTTTSPETR